MSAENSSKKTSVPALLIIGAIFTIIGFWLFWPKHDSAELQQIASLRPTNPQEQASVNSSRTRSQGIPARDYDEVHPKPTYQRNPAIKLIEGMPQRVPEPPKPIPNFATKDEEITYWQKKYEAQQSLVEQHNLFLERATRQLERAQTGVEQEQAERSLTIVKQKYQNALTKLAELETKLAELKNQAR